MISVRLCCLRKKVVASHVMLTSSWQPSCHQLDQSPASSCRAAPSVASRRGQTTTMELLPKPSTCLHSRRENNRRTCSGFAPVVSLSRRGHGRPRSPGDAGDSASQVINAWWQKPPVAVISRRVAPFHMFTRCNRREIDVIVPLSSPIGRPWVLAKM